MNSCALKCILAAGVALWSSDAAFAQKFENVAETPPMGWNSWNHFACNIDETLIRETAQAMVDQGLRDAGYVYLNLDDCWHGERDEDGFIQPDPERFPSGMKALADDVHALGLKFGIYSDAGRRTCAGKPGSQGYEYQDAKQYARWGVDYLKYDWCNTGEDEAQRNPIEAYQLMRDALYDAGRPVVLSICEWGDNEPWEWGAESGHLWRTTGDIINCWDCKVNHGSWYSLGIMNILDLQAGLREYGGPGHWNDPDMMEVGNLETVGENRAHFTMWAMLAAPLIIGTDVRDLDPAIRSILTNKDLIAVNQDALGLSGFPVLSEDGVEYWLKPLEGGNWAFVVLNRSDEAKSIEWNWPEHGLSDSQFEIRSDLEADVFQIQELWNGRDAGDTSKVLRARVPARDALAYRLNLQK